MAGHIWEPFKNSPAPIGEPYQLNFAIYVRKTANSNNQVEVLVTTRSSSDTPDGGFAALHSVRKTMVGHVIRIEFAQGTVVKGFSMEYNDLGVEWLKYTTVSNTGDHVNKLATVSVWSWETEAEEPEDTDDPKNPCNTSSSYSAKSTSGTDGLE
jgi:hypothetical protein